MLKVILGALKEPVGGIDTACVRLLQRVLPHTLKLADGLPPLVVCIQGVNDKETRHTYAHLIEEAGGEWREPNFAAERVSAAVFVVILIPLIPLIVPNPNSPTNATQTTNRIQ